MPSCGNFDTAELVSMGRVSVDLYGEQIGADLAEAQSFRRYIGGSAGNVIVGASRLGLRSALLSQVGTDAFGDYVIRQLKREGVATDSMRQDPNRSTGTIALAAHIGRNFPRMFLVADPAEFGLTAEDVDPVPIRKAEGLLITGTYLSRPHLREATQTAVHAAREGGTKIVFDVDYRPAFWGAVPMSKGEDEETVRPDISASLRTVLPDTDVVIGTVAEIRALGGSANLDAALRLIRGHTDALLIVKHGPHGCHAYPGAIPEDLTETLTSKGFAIEVLNTVGAGDAFMAGFLRGYLRGEPLPTCLRWANACGAIVVSRHACSDASPSMTELETFLAASGRSQEPLRVSPLLDAEHAATVSRYRVQDGLGVFAMDHRGYFEKLAADAGRPPDAINRLKTLLTDGFLSVNDENLSTGVLVDDTFVDTALRERLMDSCSWVGRALEINGRLPVELLGDGDPSSVVRRWPPEQVVKVLVRTAVDDTSYITNVQQERLRSLTRICRSAQRELLIEVLPPPGKVHTDGDVPEILRRWYEHDIAPAWWKLQSQTDARAWSRIADVIRDADPHCRGLLMLGGSTSAVGIKERLAAAANEPLVAGFAVGRPIFHNPSTRWIRREIDDDALVAEIADNYRMLVDSWKAVISMERGD